ncbi:MAG: hypothetical protein JWN72_23, partial [Thermoleophilia bacterium]|nr:hypothetical protein [Thermoleophilia bacterium]
MRTPYELSTIVGMNLSSTARSPFPGSVQIGTIADKWHRNEPLFAGTQVGASASTVRDAIANAAGALPDHVGLVAVSRVGDGFASFQVSQPVWDGNFFSEQAVGLEPARLQPAVGTDSSSPRFEGSKLRYVDGYRQELQRTGPVR